MRHNHAVVEKIMSCFALGMGLPEDYFKEVRAFSFSHNIGLHQVAKYAYVLK